MATSSLHPHSTNPFRDPNRSPAVTPQPTGSSGVSLNPFLSPAERLSPQASGTSQYLTPDSTGALNANSALAGPSTLAPIETQNTGSNVSPAPADHHGQSPPAKAAPPSTSLIDMSSPTQPTYEPPPGPPPPPRAPSPPMVVSEPPPPYTPAADVRHGEIPLETGPRRAYAPEWHPDGQTWRNEHVVPSPSSTAHENPRREWQRDELASPLAGSSARPNFVVSQPTGASSWSAYPGANRPPPPAHPSLGVSSLGRSNTTVGTTRVPPGPPTTEPTPGRALLYQGKVLAYPAGYECNKCHLTGYRAYDPSNPCRECWSLFGQPYEGILTYAPWDSPESVTSDEQNLQRPLPGSVSRPRPNVPSASSRPISHPSPSSPYAGLGQPHGSLPPASWSTPSRSSLRPAASISFSGRPPPGAVVVRPGDPRIGGRICWKCSGDGWQYKTMGLETKTCSACNGLGRLF